MEQNVKISASEANNTLKFIYITFATFLQD